MYERVRVFVGGACASLYWCCWWHITRSQLIGLASRALILTNFFRQTKYTNNFEDGMGNLARPSFSFFVFPSLNFRFHKVFEDLLNSWRLVSRGLVACLKNPQSKSRPHFLLIRGPVDVGRTVGLVRRGRELRINSNNSNS